MPAPTMTASAATYEASDRRTPVTRPSSPVISAICTPHRRSTPCRRCSSAKIPATRSPSTRCRGSSAISSTVTSIPAARAAAAVSSPIQPPPTIAIRRAVRKVARSRSLSGEAAQVVHTLETGAVQRQPARCGARRQHELRVAEPPAVGERDLVPALVDRGWPRHPAAARSRGRRTSRSDGRTSPRGPSCPSGSPWTAAAARRVVRPRPRSGRCAPAKPSSRNAIAPWWLRPVRRRRRRLFRCWASRTAPVGVGGHSDPRRPEGGAARAKGTRRGRTRSRGARPSGRR